MKGIWARLGYSTGIGVLRAMEEDVRNGDAPPMLNEMKGEINRLLCMPPSAGRIAG